MPILPSGKMVGISDKRARHHAAQLGVNIVKKSLLVDLYQLIDVVFSDRETYKAAEQNSYFAGFTLSERQGFSDWDDRDKVAFWQWISSKMVIDYIGRTHKRLVDTKSEAKLSKVKMPGILYLSLTRIVNNLPLNTASVSQWVNTLKNCSNRGLTKDELTYTGVIDWLKSQEGMVSKSVILEFLVGNSNKIELAFECKRVEEGLQFLPCAWRCKPDHKGDSLVRIVYCMVRYVNPQFNYKIVLMKYHYNGRYVPHWGVINAEDEWLKAESDVVCIYYTADEAMDAANKHARKSGLISMVSLPSLHYEFEKMLGGEDYQENLLLLPNFQKNFYSEHFCSRNILAHFRTTVRRDTLGRSFLFVEEIQSDWHQKGRAIGYIDESLKENAVPLAPFKKEWYQLAIKVILLKAVNEGLDGVTWTTGKMQENRYFRTDAGLRNFYDKQVPAYVQKLSKAWSGNLTTICMPGQVDTFIPRYNRETGKYSVYGFERIKETRSKFDQDGALAYMRRHSPSINLELDALLITQKMKAFIKKNGLPLFGGVIDDSSKKKPINKRAEKRHINNESINQKHMKPAAYINKQAPKIQQMLW